MKIKPTLQMVAIAKRIAEKNGVSVGAVLKKIDRCVEKTSFAWNDVFWGDSVITLNAKKYLRPASRSRLPRACGVASR